jgi:hypothetical protein
MVWACCIHGRDDRHMKKFNWRSRSARPRLAREYNTKSSFKKKDARTWLDSSGPRSGSEAAVTNMVMNLFVLELRWQFMTINSEDDSRYSSIDCDRIPPEFRWSCICLEELLTECGSAQHFSSTSACSYNYRAASGRGACLPGINRRGAYVSIMNDSWWGEGRVAKGGFGVVYLPTVSRPLSVWNVRGCIQSSKLNCNTILPHVSGRMIWNSGKKWGNKQWIRVWISVEDLAFYFFFFFFFFFTYLWRYRFRAW